MFAAFANMGGTTAETHFGDNAVTYATYFAVCWAVSAGSRYVCMYYV